MITKLEKPRLIRVNNVITITECKLQCNIDESEMDFDRWFTQSIPATILSVQQSVNRKLYATQVLLDADDEAPSSAIVFNAELKMAALMLIGHWFVNRESSSALNLNYVPMGYDFLISHHRKPAGAA